MRHRRRTNRLSRNIAERKALLKGLSISLLRYQRIMTTVAKAKEAHRTVEHLITLGKENTLYARRKAYTILNDRDMVKLLFTQVAPLFKNKRGGYTRIIRLYPRRGDGAEMAYFELTERTAEEVKKPKTKKVQEKAKKGEDKKEAQRQPSKEEPDKKDSREHPEEKAHEKKVTEHRREEKPSKKPPKTGFFKNLKQYFNRKSMD